MDFEIPQPNGREPVEPERKRPAKLFHKKSRTGCQQCRTRRVKCNEAKPICNNCQRLDLTCVYDRRRSDEAPLAKPKGNLDRCQGDYNGDPPESEQRRKLELQLFYQYISDTGPSLAIDGFSREIFVNPIPKLALQSDALLYSVYCVSAFHSASRDEANKDHHLGICHTYLNMALREHVKEIPHLNESNVDIIVLTSSMLRLYHNCVLQERPLVPYKPPTEWMRAIGSSSAIFRQAWPVIEDNPKSIARMMIGNVPTILDDEARVGAKNREGLVHLLQRQAPHELAESWDSGIQEAYESTVSYIGGVWISMNNNEPPAGISKRLAIFPMLVDKRFIGLVEEERPRALVILAHYFALFSMLRGFWWIGDSGQREVLAIAEVIPDEWRDLLQWPLQILKEQIVFTRDNSTEC